VPQAHVILYYLFLSTKGGSLLSRAILDVSRRYLMFWASELLWLCSLKVSVVCGLSGLGKGNSVITFIAGARVTWILESVEMMTVLQQI
jgi:hypothetical protein